MIFSGMYLSKKAFVGVFDADGSVRLSTVARKKSKGLNFTVDFEVSQVKKNLDLLSKIQATFGGGTIREKKRTKTQILLNVSVEYEYSAASSSAAGKAIAAYLANDLPLVPSKRRDFLLAKKMLELVPKRKKSTVEKVFLVHLAYSNSNQIKASTVVKKKAIQSRLERLGDTTALDFMRGKQEAESFVKELDKTICSYEQMLPNMNLSAEYLVGFHIGDGSFGVYYYEEGGKIKVKPIWSLTEPSIPFLSAVKNTLGCGAIVPVGKIPGNCFQFRITSWEDCVNKVLPLFQNKYLPDQRRKQFQIFEKACNLFISSKINTAEGWKELVELTYSMNTEEGRTLSKEEILHRGEA
jgi:hypothetical protein